MSGADAAPPAGYKESAQAAVALLAAGGVRELFTMPGDAFPVLEAAAQAAERGTPTPRIVTCLHEIVAVATTLSGPTTSSGPRPYGRNRKC